MVRVMFFCFFLMVLACSKKMIDGAPETGPESTDLKVLEQLHSNYTPLPENQISGDSNKQFFALYAQPVTRYQHGILGDKIEAGQLVVAFQNRIYELMLDENYVFEDVRPRLVDVDKDGVYEVICIRTHVGKGAGITIYKLSENTLELYAFVPEIGRSNRWLNIVAVDDLDKDGITELAWIQTPHIGGILKVAKIYPGELQVLDETSLYSNHAIGERNLCLSTLTLQAGKKVFYVPSQKRDSIVGFEFNGEKLLKTEAIKQAVDFSKPLYLQYNFKEIINDLLNCIHL